MKRIISFLIILTIGTFSINSFAFQNEPDGFRGIKWGTKIGTLKDMVKAGGTGDQIMYTKINDKLQIGNAELERIGYLFWKGKLCSVSIPTKGHSNWTALKKVLFLKFGDGKQQNEHIEKYSWGNLSGKTLILFEYNQFSEKGTLFMYGVKVMNAKRQFDNQKAKEGTKDF